MEQNVKRFNKLLRNTVNFENLGFQDFKIDGFVFSWELHRKIGHKTDRIDYSFSKDKWGDDLELNTISPRIIFEPVNKILMNIQNNEANYFYLADPTIIKIPNFDLEEGKYVEKSRNLLFVKNRVVNEQIFEEALEVFQEQLTSNVLPFFDKIQTLQQVNDEILEKYDWLEWSNYISGQTYFKALVILKLCNNGTKYAEFSSLYKLRIESAIKEGHTEYQDFYNCLIELCDYLESGKYLEEIA